MNSPTKDRFGYDNNVSLQTDDVGHVGAAVLAHLAPIVGLQSNDVRRNRKGFTSLEHAFHLNISRGQLFQAQNNY